MTATKEATEPKEVRFEDAKVLGIQEIGLRNF